jgi:hypothetical protein
MNNMKRIISILTLIAVCGCLMCGCSDEALGNCDTDGEISPQFVILEKWNTASGLCYDKDTKIIYIYSLTGSFNIYGCYSYTPYYVRDADDNAIIAIYNGDY